MYKSIEPTAEIESVQNSNLRNIEKCLQNFILNKMEHSC